MDNELPKENAVKYLALVRTPAGPRWDYFGEYPHLTVKDKKPIWSDDEPCDIQGLPPAYRDNEVFQIVDDSGQGCWTQMRIQ